MVSEPVCTTAIANNATTSINNNNKSQETPASLLGECCADAFGVGVGAWWGRGAGGLGGGAEPWSVLFWGDLP